MVANRFNPDLIRNHPHPRFVDIEDGIQFRGWIGPRIAVRVRVRNTAP
jgi:hypothetical protein